MGGKEHPSKTPAIMERNGAVMQFICLRYPLFSGFSDRMVRFR